MGWVIYYAVLFLAFFGTTLFAANHPGATSNWLRLVSGAVPILSGLAQAITRVNFRAYLWTQQLWLKVHGSATTNWRFGLRLDGAIGDDALTRIKGLLNTELKTWLPRVVSQKDLGMSIIIDRTIHLNISFEPASYSTDGVDHLLIASDELEVTYASARRKVDTCIVPLMNTILRNIQCEQSSTMLDIYLPAKNPFFAFFIAHLRPEQVSRFNLVFHPSEFTRNQSDKVVVTKNSISVNAQSPDAFASLLKTFLLLSENAVNINSL